MSNNHPNTPFGKFFDKIGIWHPSLEESIKDIYDKLDDAAQTAVKDASGWIAIINTNLQAAPDFIFTLIQQKFPNVTKESLTDSLNKVNTALLKADNAIPDDFAGALGKLQTYLGKYQGKPWIAVTRSVVSILADVLRNGASPIQLVETVLEYVYQTFIKGKVVPA